MTAAIGNERVVVGLHVVDPVLGPTVRWRLARS
jgi:hypothetical protein